MLYSVIIPCYNEADNVDKLKQELLPVLQRLAGTDEVEVIFVDDGSRDQTSAALHATFDGLEQANLRFVFRKHEVNRGLGAALRTGFGAAQGEILITTDSDGTYRFESIPALLARLEPGVDMVTASPYHPQGGVVGVPRYRLVLSQGASILYRVLVSWKIHTYTALFRAYRRKVVDSTTFQSDGFLAGTELMVKGMLKGYRVAEYPAVLHSRVFGTSKAKLARTVRAHLAFQWQVLLYRVGLAQLA